MKKKKRCLKAGQAKKLGLTVRPNYKGKYYAQYMITDAQWDSVRKLKKKEIAALENAELSNENKDEQKGYQEEETFFLSAYCKDTQTILTIEDFCKKYNQSFEHLASYKFLPYHYKEPSYNVFFKDVISEKIQEFDFDEIIKKHIKPVKVKEYPKAKKNDFDSLTFTDVHIGMETNPDNNSMYAVKWNKEEIIKTAQEVVKQTIINKQSKVLVVDELGDFLDGFNAQTTRGGHPLPQNMTNEEAFDCALQFKMILVDGLISHFEKLIFNNICNDNHAGSFGYFVNKAFKEICDLKYRKVQVVNHRQFINHYYVGDVCFLITHGKDDKVMKFGFKPQLDSNGLEQIDQYCKQNNIYKKAELIVFKKGDSHQALFDMCTSDDFYYFNYPALSPSSQWVQTNFKKGRRGFVLESYKGTELTIKPKFKTK